jgi:hypothetical protein
MAGHKIIRWARRYSKVAIVFALVPLVGLGALSFAACGCKGNVDFACHCQCHKGVCCDRVTSQSSCHYQAFAQSSGSQTAAVAIGGHQCTQVVGHVGIPAATVAPPSDTNFDSLALIVATDVTANPVGTFEQHFMPMDVGQPAGNLIIVLHRLVI